MGYSLLPFLDDDAAVPFAMSLPLQGPFIGIAGVAPLHLVTFAYYLLLTRHSTAVQRGLLLGFVLFMIFFWHLPLSALYLFAMGAALVSWLVQAVLPCSPSPLLPFHPSRSPAYAHNVGYRYAYAPLAIEGRPPMEGIKPPPPQLEQLDDTRFLHH